MTSVDHIVESDRTVHVHVYNGIREVVVPFALLYSGIDFAILEVEGAETLFGVRSGIDWSGRYRLERSTHERVLTTSARLRAKKEAEHV